MEMPTVCQKCEEVFDLEDGTTSEKWFKNTVICCDCADIEQDEINIDEEIIDLTNAIEDAEITIKDSFNRLKEIQEYTSPIFISLE